MAYEPIAGIVCAIGLRVVVSNDSIHGIVADLLSVKALLDATAITE